MLSALQAPLMITLSTMSPSFSSLMPRLPLIIDAPDYARWLRYGTPRLMPLIVASRLRFLYASCHYACHAFMLAGHPPLLRALSLHARYAYQRCPRYAGAMLRRYYAQRCAFSAPVR